MASFLAYSGFCVIYFIPFLYFSLSCFYPSVFFRIFALNYYTFKQKIIENNEETDCYQRVFCALLLVCISAGCEKTTTAGYEHQRIHY